MRRAAAPERCGDRIKAILFLETVVGSADAPSSRVDGQESRASLSRAGEPRYCVRYCGGDACGGGEDGDKTDRSG